MSTYLPYTEIEYQGRLYVKWIGWPADWFEKSVWLSWSLDGIEYVKTGVLPE